MLTALRVYTNGKGFFAEEVEADQIKSRADARNRGPFAAPDRKDLVTWVRPSWKDNRKARVAHFRRLPGLRLRGTSNNDITRMVAEESADKGRSSIHNDCRDQLASALRKRIGEKLKWFVSGGENSDFPFQGDLLSGVEWIETEYPIMTPLSSKYRVDIALLGPKIDGKRIILGAIEIELHHEFEFLKCLLCKCLGFPLVSLDIREFTDGDVNETSLMRTLSETTISSEDRRRRNFFYLHPFLYPLYLTLPPGLIDDKMHQYILFAKEERYLRTLNALKQVRDALKLDHQVYSIQKVSQPKNSSTKMIENEGRIAGHDWRRYNRKRFIRVSIPRPRPDDIPNKFFHILMAQIANSDEPALAGYKYAKGLRDSDSDGPIWIKRKWTGGGYTSHRICPKHLSDPIESVMEAIRSIGAELPEN